MSSRGEGAAFGGWAFAVAASVAIVACGPARPADGGADGGADARMSVETVPRCSNPDEIPFRNGMGGYACAVVGASGAAATTEWPDTTALSGPFVYVRPGAPAGGDGSMARPFPTISAGVAAIPVRGTVVLSRGVHPVTVPVAVNSTLSIQIVGTGPGPGGTIVEVSASMDGLVFSGSMQVASVQGVSARSTDATSPTGAAFTVRGGAALTLTQVNTERFNAGAAIEGSRLSLERCTFRDSTLAGVNAMGMSTVTAQRAMFSGGRYGIVSRESNVSLSFVGVSGTGRDGIAVLGAGTTPSSLASVTVLNAGVTGIRFENGARAQLERIAVSGTSVPPDTQGGDGLFVASGSQVDVGSSASTSGPGMDSAFTWNGRNGVLVSDMNTRVSLTGVVSGSNEAMGIRVNSSATLNSLAYADVVDNAGAGVVVTTGAGVAAVSNSRFRGTRLLEPRSTLFTCLVADGLALAENPTLTVAIERNTFDGNARFAMALSGVSARLDGNTGSGNRYGVYVDATSSVTGANAQRVASIETWSGGPACVLRGTF